MPEHVAKALLVYEESRADLIDQVRDLSDDVDIYPVELEQFLEEPVRFLPKGSHALVAAELDNVKRVMCCSMRETFSVGILPSEAQTRLRAYYDLPAKLEEQLDLALAPDPPSMKAVILNDHLMMVNASIGSIPVLESAHDRSKIRLAAKALRGLMRLRLFPVSIQTEGGKRIDTACCGCIVVKRHQNSLVSTLVPKDAHIADPQVSLFLAAPKSISDYLGFLWEYLNSGFNSNRLPSTVGHIRSCGWTLTTAQATPVTIDNVVETETPLRCEVIPDALRVNVGPRLREKSSKETTPVEKVDTKNTPTGKEVSKATGRHLPFFGYASEERFRDLFMALREDAKINSTYVVLMILSTMLATVGLFLSSASVVIGAMLVAPLMAPIVSLAMGITRQDEKLTVQSIKKTAFGIALALGSAALFSLLIVHKPVTAEMQARLQPSLLDLAVAIFAGIAGAYTKSFKEILQSLAGVAIAVALVPPLAVAGIGLGRGDLVFFFQAFLLFSTNLVGITLSAAFTFRILGYSPAVRNRRGLAVVMLLLGLISVPLYISYRNIVDTSISETEWQRKRFVVGTKYLIIQKAVLRHHLDHDVLHLDVLVREALSREDLAEFKRKVLLHFDQNLIVHVNFAYIL